MPDPRDLPVVHDLLRNIVHALVDRPEEVVIDAINAGAGATFNIRCHPTDTGKVIGAQGRTARSIRTILNAAAKKQDGSYAINIEQ